MADMRREGPVVVTFLDKVAEEDKKTLQSVGVSLYIVEEDNLGFPKDKDAPGTVRTGMSKLGPVLVAALETGRTAA